LGDDWRHGAGGTGGQINAPVLIEPQLDASDVAI
jgi:hypothetical protein